MQLGDGYAICRSRRTSCFNGDTIADLIILLHELFSYRNDLLDNRG
jgi:hypothetical protein